MEDRDLSRVEGELRNYLSAQLDRLPVRSAPSFSPPRRGWFRAIAALPATMLVVLIAVGAGLALSDWRAQRTASDEPQASSGGVPGPLALAGGAPSLGFGLVSTSVNTLLVRNEITETAPLTFSSVLPQVAVSPDGHSVAYWRAVPDRQTGQAVYELNRSDLLDPAVRDRLVMRAPAGEGPGPLIWSSDGTGLIANTRTPPTRGTAAAASRPTHASWFKVDVVSGKIEQLPQTFDSFSVVYAWDRSRDLITGSTISFGSPSVAGGPTFLTAKAGVVESHPVPSGGLISAADLYAKSVVIAYARGCKDPPADSTIRCTVLEVRDQATFAIITGSAPVEATSDFPDVVLRPRSQDLIVQLPLKNGDARVELWSDLGRGPHQVLATYSPVVRGTLRFTSRRELLLPRIDGSAVFLLKFDGSAGGRWFGELVGLAPTDTTRAGNDLPRTPFDILTGGNPLASVVLDPAFARAMDPRSGAAPPSAPSSAAPPVCAGQTPLLDVAQPPPPGDQPGLGAANPEAAFNQAFPTIKDYKMYEFGTTNPYVTGQTSRGPVWIVADGRTFISLHPGSPGQNSWFAHPATFLGCRTPANVGTPTLARAAEGSRTGPVSTAEIVERLNAAGLASHISPPASSRLLLFNATDQDLVTVEEPAIRGFVVYRYPSVAAATSAFRLDAVQDPGRGTVDYVAKPYFVGIGDALVVFATNDEAVARRVIAALTS